MKIRFLLVLIVLMTLAIGLAVWLLRGPRPAPKPAPKTPGTGQALTPVTPLPPPELTMATFKLTTVPASLPANLQAQTGQCTAGILIDLTAKEILWAKSPDLPVPIASMTKMMTALLLMEAIHTEHRVDMQTRVQVTAEAANIGGSQVWLDPRENFTIEDLTKCLMIKSANDAAYLLGEFLGNGNAAFVAQMNGRARELGCPGMTFYNSHGLPPNAKSPENQATPRELALLGARLLEYPDLMQICSVKTDQLRQNTPKPTMLFNHNTMISRRPCLGVDGLKTGLTAKSGHCITASCLRNGRRMIAVVTGCPKADVRDRLTAALLDWGYARQVGKPVPPLPTAPAATPAARASAEAAGGTTSAATPPPARSPHPRARDPGNAKARS